MILALSAFLFCSKMLNVNKNLAITLIILYCTDCSYKKSNPIILYVNSVRLGIILVWSLLIEKTKKNNIFDFLFPPIFIVAI